MENFVTKGENILETMNEIAVSAQNELGNTQTNLANSMAQINTMTTDMNKMSSFLDQKHTGLNKAKNRPCFMRVVVVDEDGNNPKELFFSESNYVPTVKGIVLASNKAPIGILMSKDVGEDFEWHNEVYYVREKDIFVPAKISSKWDGRKFSFEDDDDIEKGDSIQKRISEFKNCLEKIDEQDEDIWAFEGNDIETYEDESVGLSIRRSISLRSHPLLDKIQENI